MAGSVTITEVPGPIGGVRKVRFAWTSSAGGAADSAAYYVCGAILKVIFDPDGTDVPTANYDVVLNDSHGIDVLAGQGANLSASASTAVCPGVPLKDGTTTSVVPVAVNDTLTLGVTNAGNAKKGVIELHIVNA